MIAKTIAKNVMSGVPFTPDEVLVLAQSFDELLCMAQAISSRAVPAGEINGEKIVTMRRAVINSLDAVILKACDPWVTAAEQLSRKAAQANAELSAIVGITPVKNTPQQQAAITRAATKKRRARVAKFNPLEQLTVEERDILESFACSWGRHGSWKNKLATMWLNGQDASQPGGHLLRRIRNRLGPCWLVEVPANVDKW